MDQSKELTGAASHDVPMEDLHIDPPLLYSNTVQLWHQEITVEFRKHRVRRMMEAMMQRASCPQTPERLKVMASDIEGAVYILASSVGEYTTRLDAFVSHIPKRDDFLSVVQFGSSVAFGTGGVAQAGPGTAQNPQLPHSQDPMGQGLAPPQLPQGAAAAAAVPSPSPQPPAPPASGPAAQASADEVWHIASGLMDLDLDSEQQP